MDSHDRAVVSVLVAILVFVAVVIAINALTFHTLPDHWNEEDWESFAGVLESQGVKLIELLVAGTAAAIVFYLTKGGRGD